MPNQVPQPRPQTPPNPAAAIGIPGAHTINLAHGQYSISPAGVTASAVANHQMGQHPPAPMAAAPPPHQVQPSQPGNPSVSIPQQPPQTMPHNKPYVKRPRSNAISIVDPATMTAINTDAAQSAAAATAQNEGSPAPSEVSFICPNLRQYRYVRVSSKNVKISWNDKLKCLKNCW